MLSTMQPTTETLIKQEQNSPNSLSNISSPNTATNFSPNQQQRHAAQQPSQQQQQSQLSQQQSDVSNGGGTEAGAGHSMYSSYYSGGGTNGASPTEASTASDPGGASAMIGATARDGVSAPIKTADDEFGTTTVASAVGNANGSGCYTTGGAGSNDSAMTALNPGSVSANAMSAASSVSSTSMGNGFNNGNSYYAGSGMMGAGMQHFNPADSPTKQQQFYQFQQHMHQQKMQQHMLEQQKYFSSSCSTTPTSTGPASGVGGALDGMSPLAYPMSSGTSGYSANLPRFRNPFDDDDSDELPYKRQSTSTSTVGSSPSFMDCCREAFNHRSVKLPTGPPHSQQDVQLMMERNKLPFAFAAQHRRQLPIPYPAAIGAGPPPNPAEPMRMLVRMPPVYAPGMLPSNHPAILAQMVGRRPMLPFIVGPNGMLGNVIQTPNGLVFVTANGQPIQLPNNQIGLELHRRQNFAIQQMMMHQQQQHLLQQHHQQQQAQNAAGSAPQTTTAAAPKKESKKKKETKKQQQQQQQEAAAAAAAAASCSMMNGGSLPPDPSSAGNFSPGCRSADAKRQSGGFVPPMSFASGAFSPSHMRAHGAAFGGQFPPKFSMKLCPQPQFRFSVDGDCSHCKQKIGINGRPAIRCTAFGQGCRQLFHQECSGLLLDAFECLYTDAHLEWVCRTCQRARPLCYAV